MSHQGPGLAKRVILDRVSLDLKVNFDRSQEVCMFLSFELLIFLLVAGVYRLVERRRESSKLGMALDDWGKALGLVRVGNELVGQQAGVPVGARMAVEATKNSQRPCWTVYARLQPPLDLGLSVVNRQYHVKDPVAGKQGVHFADDFGRRFRVRADEDGRARQLLSSRLKDELRRLFHPDAQLLITDQGIAVQALVGNVDEGWLRRALATIVRLANLIGDERQRVGPARPLRQHRKSWERFAQNNGLSGISAPLCMYGQMVDSTVYAYSVRTTAFTYCLEIWLRFDDTLGLGLLVQPMRTVDRMKSLFGSADHKLGDPLFDETFQVTVSDGPAVEMLLDETMRKRLLELHSTIGPLSLTDDGLSIRLPMVPPNPAVVPAVVLQMLQLSKHIATCRRGQRLQGPYR